MVRRITIIVTIPVSLVSALTMNKVHNPLFCPYCQQIVSILAIGNSFQKERGLRFNRLLQLGRKYISQDLSAPTLIRHLKPLRKKGVVTRTQKAKQTVVYALNSENPMFSKEEVELTQRMDEEIVKKLSACSLDDLIDLTLCRGMMREVDRNIALLESALDRDKPERLAYRLLIRNGFHKVWEDLIDTSLNQLETTEKERAIMNYKKRYEELESEVKRLIEGVIANERKVSEI